ncbi:MAG: hypothetical protein D4S02_06305 [Rhodocyclaceae bacterium]|nr:MAG: hypothetical protein D4S02_06305 [Rhodocyclaceae bacterium]
MQVIRLLPLVLGVMGISGCTGFSSRLSGDIPRTGSLIPNTSLQVAPLLSIPLEKMVYWGAYAGTAYLILDPYAPNWDIEEAPLPRNQFHFSLKMKRFYSGGGGEARSILHRRAKELVQYGGFEGYELLEYSESLESSVLGSQRAAQGVIRLTGVGLESEPSTPESKAGTGQGNALPARMIPESAKKPRS